MVFPQIVAAYAAVLTLIFAVLSARVVAARAAMQIAHGDGGHASLNRRIRAHGNFAEYVPLTLLLAAFLEADGASALTVHALLLPLVVARAMHPIGMQAPVGSFSQYAWRATSATATWLVMVAAAILLLMRFF